MISIMQLKLPKKALLIFSQKKCYDYILFKTKTRLKQINKYGTKKFKVTINIAAAFIHLKEGRTSEQRGRFLEENSVVKNMSTISKKQHLQKGSLSGWLLVACQDYLELSFLQQRSLFKRIPFVPSNKACRAVAGIIKFS